jgi:hypothetical protein
MFALLACGPGDAPDPIVDAVLTGDCDYEVSGAEEISDVEVLAATDWLRYGALEFQAGDVLGTETAYAALQGELALSLPAVDFSERVVIASWAPSASCETHVGDWLVLDVNDHTHLHASFDDGSACGTCDHAGGAFLAVSVPIRPTFPSWCRAVVDICP